MLETKFRDNQIRVMELDFMKLSTSTMIYFDYDLTTFARVSPCIGYDDT